MCQIHAKYFTYIISSKPHDNSIILTLKVRKLELRELKSLSQGGTADEW